MFCAFYVFNCLYIYIMLYYFAHLCNFKQLMMFLYVYNKYMYTIWDFFSRVKSVSFINIIYSVYKYVFCRESAVCSFIKLKLKNYKL